MKRQHASKLELAEEAREEARRIVHEIAENDQEIQEWDQSIESWREYMTKDTLDHALWRLRVDTDRIKAKQCRLKEKAGKVRRHAINLCIGAGLAPEDAKRFADS